MALLSIPVWTIPPDWSNPVTENLEWLTSIMTSVPGAEQRQKLRNTPRRTFEFTSRPIGRWRTYLDALLTVPNQGNYYLPVWHEASELDTDAAESDGTLSVEGTRLELSNASVVFIQGLLPHQFELAEIVSSTVGDNTVFTLAAPLSGAWPHGTAVYPCVPAQFVQQPTANRLLSNLFETTIKFRTTIPNNWPLLADFGTYNDFPVFLLPIDYGEAQSAGYDRLTAMLDNDAGIVAQLDLGGIPFQKFGSTTFFSGRAPNDSLRSLLYTLQGKLTAAWFVNPAEDFELTQHITTGDVSMTVARSGFSDLGGPVPNRQDLFILMRDGTNYIQRITGSVILDDNNERLTVATPFSADIDPKDVEYISFMAFGRLDQDSIDLVHQTDSDGVCGVSLAIKSIPDLRSATDWTPPPLPRTSFGACGNNGLWLNAYAPGLGWSGWIGSAPGDPSIGENPLDLTGFFNWEGSPAPAFPAVSVNTGSDMAGSGIRFNFGRTPFLGTMPFAAAPYGADVTLSPTDKAGSINLTGDNLEMWVGAGNVRNFIRATAPTSSRLGLRYYEMIFENVAFISAFFGFMVGDAPLNLATGDVTDPTYIMAGAPTSHPGFFMPGFNQSTSPVPAGAAIAFAIFTKG